MKELRNVVFRRRFSVNPYKSLRLDMMKMDCCKDWVQTDFGQPYPILDKENDELTESVADRCYIVQNNTEKAGRVVRLLGGHFPYATYAVSIGTQAGCAGICIKMDENQGSAGAAVSVLAYISGQQARIETECVQDGEKTQTQVFADNLPSGPDMTLIVTCRGANLDIYWQVGDTMRALGVFYAEALRDIILYHRFIGATVGLEVRLSPGQRVSCTAQGYLDSGVSHADIKCMRYENGQPIMTDGRLYLTMSARAEQGSYQAVFSWNPSGCNLRLEGALFFDYGDDAWCSDVASSVIFDRSTSLWYVWACAFSHGHVLCHAVSTADLRHGIHVLDATLMPAQHAEQTDLGVLERSAGSTQGLSYTIDDDTLFFAKTGDEDPDLVFDEQNQRWLLAVCRLITLSDGKNAYRYFLFESDEPFSGFRYLGNTCAGSTTGGSFIRYDGKMYFLCGSDFDKTSQYYLYELNNLEHFDLLRFNYPDGGFRGWGTLIPVPCGSRTRYLHITFDRHGGSDWRWSYGNLYVFEADEMRKEAEWASGKL